MTDQQLMKTIQSKILSLGQTSPEIAESLLEMGIKGIPEDGERCPLGRFVRSIPKVLEGGWRVDVGSYRILLYSSPEEVNYREVCFPLTVEDVRHIGDFIEDVDAGDYPELIEWDVQDEGESEEESD